MYKKTTTTIVEEADADFLGIKAAPTRGVFSNTSDENTNTGVIFRQSMMKYYNDIVKMMREYLINKQYAPEALPLLVAALEKFKTDSSGVFFPYFGPTNTPNIVDSQNAVITEIVNILDLIASGKPFNPADQTARAKIMDFDNKVTRSFAPTVLPPGSVANYWNSFLNSVEQQANARMAKDWASDQDALKAAIETMVFGEPTGISGFGDAFAKAIIKTTPGRTWV